MIDRNTDLTTPEQCEAIKRMKENFPPEEIFKEVAASILQTVPDANTKDLWRHGSCRIVGRIGGYDIWNFENGFAPSDADLSKIDYVAFYRQAVQNKNTREVKGFVATVPLSFSGEVEPGKTLTVKETIPFDWKREDVEAMARESFLKLQELCEEYYNREAE
jgi:hypothetical protein